MKMLIQRGGDVHTSRRPEGWSALHIACQRGHRRVVRLLVDKGWDIHARDANGRTPLQLAEEAGHGEVVEVLRKAGGSIAA